MEALKHIVMFIAAHQIFLMMLAVGLEINWGEIREKANRSVVFRCGLIAFLFEPLLAFVIIKLLPFQSLGIGTILLMSISPGAPAILRKVHRSAGKEIYTALALVLVLSFTAIALLPLYLELINRFTPLTLRSDLPHLMIAIVFSIFIPFLIGMGIRRWSAPFSDRILPWVWRFYHLIFIGTAVILVVMSAHFFKELPLRTYVAMFFITVASGVVASFSSRSLSESDRKLVAMTIITGNPSIALFVGRLSFPTSEILPAIAIYILLRSLFLLPQKLLR